MLLANGEGIIGNYGGGTMNSKHSGRRRFLKNSAALAGLVVGAKLPAGGQQPYKPAIVTGVGVRPLGEISRFEKKVRKGLTGLKPEPDSTTGQCCACAAPSGPGTPSGPFP